MQNITEINELIKLSANWEKNEWLYKIIKLEKKSRTMINNKLDSSLLTNGSAAKISLESLQSGDTMFVGNSLPIRDMDLFTTNSDKNINIYANRGASGIDGIISTAMGISHSNSSSVCKNLLLIGDLSFYHDMNGLIAAKRYDINLIIIVENNHGGGIFRKLSINENNPNFPRGKDTKTNYGFNYRMTEMQGAVGKAQLAKLNYIIAENKKRYDALEKTVPVTVTKRQILEGSEPIYDTFIFFADTSEDKDRYVQILTDEGFGTKNLPDAMEWHCTAFWDHALDQKQVEHSQKTRDLLEKALAVPIWLRKMPKEYSVLAKKLFHN